MAKKEDKDKSKSSDETTKEFTEAEKEVNRKRMEGYKNINNESN